MPYITESIAAPIGIENEVAPLKEFDLPIKEFRGYDPKTAKKAVAETPPAEAAQENSQQNENSESPVSAEEAPQTKEESVTLSPKIAAIARKEQAVRQREIAAAKREKELEALAGDAEKYRQMKAKLAAKDYSVLEEEGVKYDDHLKYETEKIERQDPKEERTRKLEAELETLKKNLEERDTQDYETNQSLWKEEIARVVDSNPAFSALKKAGGHKAVLDHINDSFDEDGIKLTAEQAAKEINDALVARAKKFASFLDNEKTVEGKVLGPPPKKTTETITQNMTVTSKAPSKKPFWQMSESEQLEEAIRKVNEEKLKRQQSMR